VGHLLHPVPIHAFVGIEYIPGLAPRRKSSGTTIYRVSHGREALNSA
jgi:hypothetical protein